MEKQVHGLIDQLYDQHLWLDNIEQDLLSRIVQYSKTTANIKTLIVLRERGLWGTYIYKDWVEEQWLKVNWGNECLVGKVKPYRESFGLRTIALVDMLDDPEREDYLQNDWSFM